MNNRKYLKKIKNKFVFLEKQQRIIKNGDQQSVKDST